MKKVLLLFAFTALMACSGSDESGGGSKNDSFDRKAMLANWADNIIVPAYINYQAKVGGLDAKAVVFAETVNQANLDALRTAWLDAYKAFQHVSMFEIGKAEELKLQNFSNIYPAQIEANANDNAGINQNISSGSYDLNALSSIDEQGFPTLDYVLFGLADSDTEILDLYSSNALAANYKKYLTDLTARLKTIADAVLADWQNGYRDTFVNNTGNTSTSSTNKLVNDFIFNYERNVRAGKVGIPSGVFSGGNVFSDKVEAYFKNDVSKTLFDESLKATQNFFNGKAFNGGAAGPSLKSYLDYLNTIKSGADLSTIINNQFETTKTKSQQLSASFSEQVETNNALMIDVYDELQRNVVYFKVDMLSALSISVDYVDADGD